MMERPREDTQMQSAARVTKPPKPPAVEEESRLWEFTLADYHRMCEVGILGEDDRCEFINGRNPTTCQNSRTSLGAGVGSTFPSRSKRKTWLPC